MAPCLRAALLLCLPAVSSGVRELGKHLSQLVSGEGLPCKLKVKYGQGKDPYDGSVVESITFLADCKADIHDCWLDQPYLLEKDTGEIVSVQIEGKEGVLKAGISQLRTLRLVDDHFGGSYVGKTFTFRATTEDGTKGSVSVTIDDPEEARAKEAAAMQAGGLPCDLQAVPVDLQGGGKGFKITASCTEDVRGELKMPKPYRDMRPVLKKGGNYKLTIVDASKLQSRTFVLMGKFGEDDKEGSVSVTVPEADEEVQKTDVKVPEEPEKKEEPATATTSKTPEADGKEEAGSQGATDKGDKKTSQQVAEGKLPCELKVAYGKAVDPDDGEVDSITLTADCVEDIQDVWLDEPEADTDKISSVQFQGEDEVMKAGAYELRTLRLHDTSGASYVGKTFTFRAKMLGGGTGSVSVTIQEPAKAKADEEAALASGGSLPCDLKAESVGLEGGGKGFQIMISCTEEVSGELKVPEPYGGFQTVIEAGPTFELLVVDSSKLESRKFAFVGKLGDGKEGSVSLTVPE